MRIKRFILFVLLGLMLFPVLSGCWDYRRIDETAMVMGLGVDPVGKSNYQITFQVPSMPGVLSGGEGAASSGGGAPPATTINITVTGGAFGEAISKAQERLDRTLFFGNLQSIVLNKQLGQNRTEDLLTELLRNSRIPNTASLFLTKDTALGVLSSKEITDEPVSIFLRNSVRNIKSTGFEEPVPLWVYFRNTFGLGITPVVPRVYSDPEGKLIFDGLSVYQNFKWMGDLTREQARGYNWTVGKVKIMQLMVQDHNKPIVVDISHDKAHLSWKKIEGRYHLYVDVQAEGIILQDPSKGMDYVTMQEENQMRKKVQKEISTEIRSAFKSFQGWGTDPYGFGRLILIQNPHLFRQDVLSNNWIQDFKDSQLHVRVHMAIKGKGELL